MKPCKVICKNGEAREVNPFEKYPTMPIVLGLPQDEGEEWKTFEANIKVYPAPGIPDGEHLCEMIYQERKSDQHEWEPCVIDGYDPILRTGYEHRQIWVLASPEMNNQNNKGMETVEEAARKYSSKHYGGERNRKWGIQDFIAGAQWAKQQSDGETTGNFQPLFDHMSQEHGLTLTQGEMFEIIHVVNRIQGSDGDRWINALKQTPNLIPGKDYSENVLAIINGELGVACFCYINNGDREESGFAWASCDGNLDGDAEFDDEYDVTWWMPKPEPPTNN